MVNTKFILFFSWITFFTANVNAQEDSVNIFENDATEKEYVSGAFKSSRVIMSHSIEMLKEGVLDFRILHRFGNFNLGISQLFGLDQATIRLGLDYALSNNFTIGVGRSSFNKELDGFLKYRLFRQSTGVGAQPFTLVLVGGSTLNTSRLTDSIQKSKFSYRLGYYSLAIIGRKFSNAFSLQLAPTFLHRNYVTSREDKNNLFATGIGGRIKLTNRVSLNADYYYVFNQNETLKLHNPLSIGFDIETGGHVFQLHFTNAVGMNERVFLTETNNNWWNGDIQFGFNISRVFQIKKNRNIDD